MHRAKGTFEVKVTPAEATPFEKEIGLTRYTLEKTLHGDLEGTARGEMMATSTEATGAMGYVAIDHLHVTLAGRTGSFTLAHRASMIKGDAASAHMSIEVVPSSGTDGLKGIAGTFEIIIDSKGGHSYDLAYTLP